MQGTMPEAWHHLRLACLLLVSLASSDAQTLQQTSCKEVQEGAGVAGCTHHPQSPGHPAGTAAPSGDPAHPAAGLAAAVELPLVLL